MLARHTLGSSDNLAAGRRSPRRARSPRHRPRPPPRDAPAFDLGGQGSGHVAADTCPDRNGNLNGNGTSFHEGGSGGVRGVSRGGGGGAWSNVLAGGGGVRHSRQRSKSKSPDRRPPTPRGAAGGDGVRGLRIYTHPGGDSPGSAMGSPGSGGAFGGASSGGAFSGLGSGGSGSGGAGARRSSDYGGGLGSGSGSSGFGKGFGSALGSPGLGRTASFASGLGSPGAPLSAGAAGGRGGMISLGSGGSSSVSRGAGGGFGTGISGLLVGSGGGREAPPASVRAASTSSWREGSDSGAEGDDEMQELIVDNRADGVLDGPYCDVADGDGAP